MVVLAFYIGMVMQFTNGGSGSGGSPGSTPSSKCFDFPKLY